MIKHHCDNCDAVIHTVQGFRITIPDGFQCVVDLRAFKDDGPLELCPLCLHRAAVVLAQVLAVGRVPNTETAS